MDTSTSALSRRDELAFAVFSTWSIVGLFLDGWSHRHDKPETFFTPYHLVLYSGFAAAALWSAREAARQRRAGEAFAVPGGRLTILAAALIALGGGADMVWHEVFGVEADTEALLSPTHLLLFVGGILLTSGPVRAAWSAPGDVAPTLVEFLPRVVGLALATSIAAFVTQFVHPFLADSFRPGDAADVWIGGLFLQTVVLMVPLLTMLRRWRVPPGAVTVYVAAVTLLVLGLEAFERWPVVIAALAAGAVGDALVDRPHALGAAVPAVLWAAFFAVVPFTDDFGWTVELWAGATAVAALGGLALAVLAFPPAVPAAPTAAARKEERAPERARS